MTEILQKYRDRLKYSERLIGAYQKALIGSLGHVRKMVKGSGVVEKALSDLIERAEKAENVFQIESIQKEYLAIRKEVDALLAQSGAQGGGLLSGIGSLFGGGGKGGEEETKEQAKSVERGDYDLLEKSEVDLAPYQTLLEAFSKGTLLLADEDEPFYTPLLSHRRKKFSPLAQKDSSGLSHSLYNFFIGKSNEVGSAQSERAELKRMLGLLASHINALAVNSDKFGNTLKISSKKIAAAQSIDEVKKLQRIVLAETMNIQKANGAVREKLLDTERQVDAATQRILKLEKELAMAREEKSVDALTQLYNRGYYDERIEEAVATCKREQEPLCLMIFDIDHFKKFNDTYGHQTGDQVLKVVSQISKESVRASDTVARYGGEEFVVILYKTAIDSGAKVAETVRRNIGAHEFGLQGKTLHVTVSVGVTQLTADDTPESILKRADKGLYVGKEKGRNRVVKV